MLISASNYQSEELTKNWHPAKPIQEEGAENRRRNDGQLTDERLEEYPSLAEIIIEIHLATGGCGVEVCVFQLSAWESGREQVRVIERAVVQHGVAEIRPS